ncbi:hypothetical protein [Flavobacterium frigidarium]|uniref:hypothetical protein n=1 Tax=Flavobacterium frigidarium TaxID=99286 RepID=UPI00040E7F32|nr:hypothetical protein [Flavobacterium frigidarium]
MKIAKIFLGTLLVLAGMGQKGHAQDWANLNKYKSENEQLLQKELTTKSVVFMGILSPSFGQENLQNIFRSGNTSTEASAGKRLRKCYCDLDQM